MIRTPSENQIILEKVPDPEKTVELINKTKNSLKHREQGYEKNTEFISIPFVRIFDIKRISYNILNKIIFGLKVPTNLAHLVYKKRLLNFKYTYYLFLESLRPGNRFIAKYLLSLLFNKGKRITWRNILKSR